jgi:eukaryotic-like serine/threonine-protein kinase
MGGRRVALFAMVGLIVFGLGAMAATLVWMTLDQPRPTAPATPARQAAQPAAAESLAESVESSPESEGRAGALPPDERSIVCFRGNPERNLSGVGPVPRHPKVLWRFRTKGKIEGPTERRGDAQVKPGTLWEGTGWTGQPCILDGKVYFGSTDSYVYCLDLLTGKQNWFYPNHHNIKGSISIQGGRIYHGGRDNKVHCYTLDGRMVWETRIGEDTDSNPLLIGDTLYIGGEDNSVYAFDPAKGTIRWRHTPTKWSCECSPCIAEGVLVIGSSGGGLYCLNPKTGERIWELDTGGDGDPTPVFWKGRVYHSIHVRGGVDRGKVSCIDVGKGERVWQKDLPRGVWATAAVSRKWDRVYVGCNDGVLYALDSNTGETVWQRKLGNRIWSSPVVTDGCIIVGVRDGTMWCLEEETGTPIWVFDEGFDIDSTPAVADGMVAIGSQNGWVYGIGEDPKGGSPSTHWFRQGPEFARPTDRDASGTATVMSSAPDPKQYPDTHAGCTDNLRVPVYGPAYEGEKPPAPQAKP